jgi:hypothetical protein
MDIESRPISTEKTAVAARQGVISGRVVTVLATSIALAILAIGISFWGIR